MGALLDMGACARVISGMVGKKMCFFGFGDLFLCVDLCVVCVLSLIVVSFGQFLLLKRENNNFLSFSFLVIISYFMKLFNVLLRAKFAK